ncbi:DDE domain-containing protein [Acinetobacter terrestris]|nr:DDE domain-containing protein [Acinetobacter terrestris]
MQIKHTYGGALSRLKWERKCPPDLEYRQVKYKNNVIECNHGKLKRIIRATLGFKSMKTAMPHASIQMALNTDDVQTK